MHNEAQDSSSRFQFVISNFEFFTDLGFPCLKVDSISVHVRPWISNLELSVWPWTHSTSNWFQFTNSEFLDLEQVLKFLYYDLGDLYLGLGSSWDRLLIVCSWIDWTVQHWTVWIVPLLFLNCWLTWVGDSWLDFGNLSSTFLIVGWNSTFVAGPFFFGFTLKGCNNYVWLHWSVWNWLIKLGLLRSAQLISYFCDHENWAVLCPWVNEGSSRQEGYGRSYAANFWLRNWDEFLNWKEY